MNKLQTIINKIVRWKNFVRFHLRRFVGFMREDQVFHLSVLFIFLIIFPLIKTPEINVPLLETSTNARDLLLVVIQSLAQILGIIGALILITFQIHKRSFDALAMKQLFNKGIIRNTFLFYIFSIIYALIALFLLNTIPDYSDLKYAQISGLLFIAALFLLLPLIERIFSFSRAVEQAKYQLSRLKPYGFEYFQYYRRMRLDCNYWKAIENHPIVVVTDGAIGALSNGDSVAVSQAVVEVNSCMFAILKKTSNKRDVINAFLYFFRNLSQEAIEAKNQRVLSLILDALKELHFYAAEKKYQWHELIELDEFIEEFLLACLRNSLDGIVNEGRYAIEFINEAHLEHNCPSPNELLDYDGGTLKIKEIPKDRGHDKDLQWHHLSSDYIRLIATVAEEAANNSKPSIVAGYSRALVSLVDKVIEMDNLSDGMKGKISGWAYYFAQSLTERILKFKLWELATLPFPFSEHSIDIALSTKAEYSKDLLLKYSEALIMLAKYNTLSSFYLNDYGAFGRGLTRQLSEDKIYRQAFKLVLVTFDKIRIITSKHKENPGDENSYSETYKQVLSLKKWLESNKGLAEHIAWVEVLLGKFNQKLVKRRQKKKYSNDWPVSVK